VVNLNLVSAVGDDNLSLLGNLDLWDSGDNNLGTGLNDGMDGLVHVWNLNSLLSGGSAGRGGDLMKLSQIVSQVLMFEFNRSLGFNSDSSSGGWLLVNHNGLSGDVSFNRSTWNVLSVLGNESTDFGLGNSKGGSLTLLGHM
jgi:hypothetical protein